MKNKILSMLLSLAIAFGLWFYVITVVSPGSEEPYYNIPIVFEGETALTERGLMITEGGTASANLVLSGNRSDLIKVNSSNITLKVDLSKVYDAGVHKLSYGISFPGDVSNDAFNVESKSPSLITITVEKRLKKAVPVNVVPAGAVPEGFLADTENILLDYPMIEVNGPSSVVELIDHARIDVDLEDRIESISENYRYTLCDEDGNPVDVEQVVTDVAEVHLDLKIQRYKEVELVLDVSYGGGTSEQTAKVDIKPNKIKVSGSEAMLEDLTQINLGSIDLATISENTQMSFPIKLDEGVSNLSGITDAAVDISFVGLSVKEFTVENINVINVPEGMEYELMNEAMTVTLRGPTAAISAIKPENIIVTVDLSGKELGASTVRALIGVEGDGFTSVGPLGAHSVPVTLTEKGN